MRAAILTSLTAMLLGACGASPEETPSIPGAKGDHERAVACAMGEELTADGQCVPAPCAVGEERDADGACVAASCTWKEAGACGEAGYCFGSFCALCDDGSFEGIGQGYVYRNCDSSYECECLVAVPETDDGHYPMGRCEGGRCVPLPEQPCEPGRLLLPELAMLWTCSDGFWAIE